jgi:hypothetical protein
MGNGKDGRQAVDFCRSLKISAQQPELTDLRGRGPIVEFIVVAHLTKPVVHFARRVHLRKMSATYSLP